MAKINTILTTTVFSENHVALLCREVDLPAAPHEGLTVGFDIESGDAATIAEVGYDVQNQTYVCDCGIDESEDDDIADILTEYAGWTIVGIYSRYHVKEDRDC
jgi:hypothetical protein